MHVSGGWRLGLANFPSPAHGSSCQRRPPAPCPHHLLSQPQPQYYAAPAYAPPGAAPPPPPYYAYQPGPGGAYYAYPAAGPPGAAPPAQGVPVPGAAPAPPGGAAGGSPAAGPAAPPKDFDAMSVGELKQYISSRGATLSGAIEKQDLVAICRALSS